MTYVSASSAVCGRGYAYFQEEFIGAESGLAGSREEAGTEDGSLSTRPRDNEFGVVGDEWRGRVRGGGGGATGASEGGQGRGRVRANEPGALAYIVHRNQEDLSEIVFFEHYADDAAFESHGKTAHMAVMSENFADIFDTATVKIERLDRVAGVLRAG